MLAIGCDHAGYELKQEIIRHLEEKGIACRISAVTARKR